MSDEKSAAYNSFTANWISRIDSMNNSIILVSGGVMSITIGAFLSSEPPELNAYSVTYIQLSWAFLAASLACAIMLKFILVVSSALVLNAWENKIKIESDGRIIIDSPFWVRCLGWLFGIFSVFSCLVGFILIAYGAGSLL